MCSTLEQMENFLRSPPSDCLNLSTNNGLDLSCSSSYYNEECLNLSSKESLSQKPQDLSLQHQHPHQNEIVNLSTTDSRNYYYPTRQEEEYYSNSGYDRNSPLNLERRSSPLNLTFATSSKQRDLSNKYYGYNNTNQNGNNGYYLQNSCGGYGNNSSSDYTNYNSYSNNNQNQMYCNYSTNYYNPQSVQPNDVYFTCTQCGSNFRDQVSLENHIKTSHKIPSSSTTPSLWNNQQYNHYSNNNNNSGMNNSNSLNMPQNYVTRQVEMSSYNYAPSMNDESSQILHQPQQIPSQHQQPPQSIQSDPLAPNSNMNTQFHSAMEPLESLSHPCTECKMTFTSGRDLKKHIDLAHEGRKKLTEEIKIYQCATCLKEFSSTISLNIHVQEHKSEKPHKCDKCPQLFRNASGLKRHLKRVHGNEKQSFKCETCGKRFYERHDLLRHVKIHSVPKCNDCGKNMKNNNHDCKKKASWRRMYPCEICSDNLDSKIAWGIHMWKHTKDSSYIRTTEDDDEEDVAQKNQNIFLSKEVPSDPPPEAHNQYSLERSVPLCLQKTSLILSEDPKPLDMHQTNST